MKKKPNFIQIEPVKLFDKAIHKRLPSGYIIYDYWKLIKICHKLYGGTTEDARDWVEYNILGLNDSEETYFGVHYLDVEVCHKVGGRVRPKMIRKVGKKKPRRG